MMKFIPRRFDVILDIEKRGKVGVLLNRHTNGTVYPLSYDEARKVAVNYIKSEQWGLAIPPHTTATTARRYDLVSIGDHSLKAVIRIVQVSS